MPKQKVVLFQPRCGSLDNLVARLPLGLLSIAGSINKEIYEVVLIDQRVELDWHKKIVNFVQAGVVCVAVTCMTGPQIKYALEVSQLIKKVDPGCFVVWGGHHPTLLPRQTLKNKYIDAVIIGEGESSFPRLLGTLVQRRSLALVPGIAYKTKTKKIVINPQGSAPKVFPELPYRLINLNKYSSLKIKGLSIDFESSRGCPYTCAFCHNSLKTIQGWRGMTAAETLKRITCLRNKYSIETFYFIDENFFVDLNRVRLIAQGICASNLKIFWGVAGLRVDTILRIPPALWELLVRSGCRTLDVGVESGSQRILDMVNKHITVSQILAASRLLAKYPFVVKYNLMIGFPTETLEEVYQTVDLAQKLIQENQKAWTPVFVYVPYPGTKLYDRVIRLGFRPPQNLEAWSKYGMSSDWYLRETPKYLAVPPAELRKIAFVSYFCSSNILHKIDNYFIRSLVNIYRPIAACRMKHKNYSFFLEKVLMNFL